MAPHFDACPAYATVPTRAGCMHNPIAGDLPCPMSIVSLFDSDRPCSCTVVGNARSPQTATRRVMSPRLVHIALRSSRCRNLPVSAHGVVPRPVSSITATHVQAACSVTTPARAATRALELWHNAYLWTTARPNRRGAPRQRPVIGRRGRRWQITP